MSANSAHLGINWTSECSVCKIGGQGVMFDIFQFFSLSQRIGRLVQTKFQRDQLRSPYLCKPCMERLEIIEKFEDMRQEFVAGFLNNCGTSPAARRHDNLPDDDCSIISPKSDRKPFRKAERLDEKLLSVISDSASPDAGRKLATPPAVRRRILSGGSSAQPFGLVVQRPARPVPPVQQCRSDRQEADCLRVMSLGGQNVRVVGLLNEGERPTSSASGSIGTETIKSDETFLVYPADSVAAPETATRSTSPNLRNLAANQDPPSLEQSKTESVDDAGGEALILVDNRSQETVDYPELELSPVDIATTIELRPETPEPGNDVCQIKIEDCRTVPPPPIIDLALDDDDPPTPIKTEQTPKVEPHRNAAAGLAANNAMLETVVESFLNWDESVSEPASPSSQMQVADSPRNLSPLPTSMPLQRHSAAEGSLRTAFQTDPPRSTLVETSRTTFRGSAPPRSPTIKRLGTSFKSTSSQLSIVKTSRTLFQTSPTKSRTTKCSETDMPTFSPRQQPEVIHRPKISVAPRSLTQNPIEVVAPRPPPLQLPTEVADPRRTAASTGKKSTLPGRTSTGLRQLLPKVSPPRPHKVARITDASSPHCSTVNVSSTTNQQALQSVQYMVNPVALSGKGSFQFSNDQAATTSLLYPFSTINSVPDQPMVAGMSSQMVGNSSQMIFVGGVPTFAYVGPGVGQASSLVQSLQSSGGFCMQQFGQMQNQNLAGSSQSIQPPKMPIYPLKREKR